MNIIGENVYTQINGQIHVSVQLNDVILIHGSQCLRLIKLVRDRIWKHLQKPI